MSNSVQPYGQQPTRLLYPWDSLGKNTGVGCHFLLHDKFYNGSQIEEKCQMSLLLNHSAKTIQSPTME